MLKRLLTLFSINLSAVLLVILGSVAWSLTMVRSGLTYSYGMGFWGPNGHDGVWHIALINSLARGSFEMPVFAGVQLQNYHIGYDLLLAAIHKATTIPVSTLFFQLFPVLTAIFVGFLTYSFVYLWKKSKQMAFWSTFFVYFGGNLGWIVTLIRSGDLGGESLFWSQQAISTLINPPFALSLVLILAGLIVLVSKKTLTTSYFLLATAIFGLLIAIKAYAGVIVIGALFIVGIYQLWRARDYSYLKLWVFSSVLAFLVFYPLNRSAGSLLEFKPFWFLETMMAFPDRLGWMKFGEAMVNYKTGGIWLKGIAAYGLALLFFWYGNMGTRAVQELYVVKFLKNKVWPEKLDVFILSAILIGFVMTMLFVQKGTAWNTIQFFYYVQFFSAILAGVVFGGIIEIKKNKKIKHYLIAGVLFFTIPTTLATLKHYLPSRPPAMISLGELEALNAMNKQPNGIVLTIPFDRKAADEAVNNPPRPLYLYESTAYVSAFSNKSVFLEDEVNLDITGYDWKKRRSEVENYLSLTNEQAAITFLKENNIEYIYIPKKLYDKQPLGNLESIFENDEVRIYRVNR